MKELVYRFLFPFGGIGAGALGMQRARVKMLGVDARIEVMGCVDNDPLACQDFTYLTGAPALCADVQKMRPRDLINAFGEKAPDGIFSSPPCKGFSGLLSDKLSKTDKYQTMNRLIIDWMELMFEAWPEGPRVVLIENVPRIQSRGKTLLSKVKKLLNQHGYVCHGSTHDCGEIGGLGQHRMRFLLAARKQKSVPTVLYQPIKVRVKSCGEVLEKLPMPEDPAGGPMHKLPKISWINWVRLALIPAGGDWRDLPGVLEDGQQRREKFKRKAVEDWNQPTGTVGGPGSNGVENVADPRIQLACMSTDNPNRHHNKYVVAAWDEPSKTVIGATRPGSGALSVADPRVDPAVIRPPAGCYDHGYAVLDWKNEPSPTVAGGSAVGQGAYSVADARFEEYVALKCRPRPGTYGTISWKEASKTVTGSAWIDNGAFAVCDPRTPQAPLFVIRSLKDKPPVVPVIVAKDGTWHRPLTTLELAALQDLPTVVNGEPLKLAGDNVSAWRERIGNAVPPGAAEAIGVRYLTCLVESDLGAWSLSSGGAVWVEPHAEQ